MIITYEGKKKKERETEFEFESERILLSTGKKSSRFLHERDDMQRDESLRWRARSESIMPRRGRWVHDSTESSMGEERRSNSSSNNNNNNNTATTTATTREREKEEEEEEGRGGRKIKRKEKKERS